MIIEDVTKSRRFAEDLESKGRFGRRWLNANLNPDPNNDRLESALEEYEDILAEVQFPHDLICTLTGLTGRWLTRRNFSATPSLWISS